MFKVIAWVMANGASILGIVQAVIKAVKEIITAVVNLFSIFMSPEMAEKTVETLRYWINKIDWAVEALKSRLL